MGVITIGTTVLGLGNIGSLAAKQVTEGMPVQKVRRHEVFDMEFSESNFANPLSSLL